MPDITRTFPVSGRFEQKALYNVVLDAQYAAIDAVRPVTTGIIPTKRH